MKRDVGSPGKHSRTHSFMGYPHRQGSRARSHNHQSYSSLDKKPVYNKINNAFAVFFFSASQLKKKSVGAILQVINLLEKRTESVAIEVESNTIFVVSQLCLHSFRRHVQVKQSG